MRIPHFFIAAFVFAGLAASAAQASTALLDPILPNKAAEAATKALKRPEFGEALPSTLKRSEHADLIATLRDWQAIQSDRLDAHDIGDVARRAAQLMDYPRWTTTRRRIEAQLAFDDPPETILAWFAVAQPITGKGEMLHADALIRSGIDSAEQTTQLRSGWRRAWLSFDEEDGVMSRHRARLSEEDHTERAHFLMAYEGYSAARRMLLRLPADQRALINARLKLRGSLAGVDSAIKTVPDTLKNDPSLILDRAYWRRNKGRDEAAMELLTPNLSAMALKRPERLWRERHFWARRLLRLKDPARAYNLASNHGLTLAPSEDRSKVRVAYADAEWTAGWIALRFLDRPEQALVHFQRMYDNVGTPVSRSRGAYWLGRAAQALGDSVAMTQWYQRAAMHPHRYYGRLAAENLDTPPVAMSLDISIVAPIDTQTAYAAFLNRPLIEATRVLKDAGRDDLVGVFTAHIAWQQETPEDVYLMARFGAELGRPDLPLRVAKKLEADGIVYSDAGYPTIKLSSKLKSKAALMHAIARQESAFDPTVVSRAGARGLMQLMPATAKRMARDNNIRYRFDALTADPAYNMTLSSHYLDFLDEKFSGTTPLMVASYNAGENATARWLDTYGDPRDANIDEIDWMELIPYAETRNYVQRVLEALVLYDQKLTPERKRPLHSLLSGKVGTDG